MLQTMSDRVNSEACVKAKTPQRKRAGLWQELPKATLYCKPNNLQ